MFDVIIFYFSGIVVGRSKNCNNCFERKFDARTLCFVRKIVSGEEWLVVRRRKVLIGWST